MAVYVPSSDNANQQQQSNYGYKANNMDVESSIVTVMNKNNNNCNNYVPKSFNHSGVYYLDQINNDDVSCCKLSRSNPGQGACLCSIFWGLVFTVLFVVGILATLLYYIGGMEFHTIQHRGAYFGPICLAMSSVPLFFVAILLLRVMSQIRQFSQQIREEEAIISRKIYLDNQSHSALNTDRRHDANLNIQQPVYLINGRNPVQIASPNLDNTSMISESSITYAKPMRFPLR